MTLKPPAHLTWAGHSNSVELSIDDGDAREAMDIALALVPELRLAALALVRARQAALQYPIVSAASLDNLLGDGRHLIAGGHNIDPAAIQRFLVPGDLPIESESGLANVVYTALQRCRYRHHLSQALEQFDAGLGPNPKQTEMTK